MKNDAARPTPLPGEEGTASPEETGARVAELEDRLLRTLADLENFRKRVAQEMAAARAEERLEIARQWLPVVDSLDSALSHAQAEPAAILDGIQAVREQAIATLEQLGFPRHTEPGARFDPRQHEAVAVVPAAAAPGTVVDVVRPGYGTGPRQLRPAAVVVAREDDGPPG